MKKDIILSNGIRLVSHQLPYLHSVTISVSFRAGRIFETENTAGISHLIEHLFFRKLDDLSYRDLSSETYRIGSEMRGSTYGDTVSFKITVVPRFFSEAFHLMARILHEFDWSADLIEQEKRLVLNQIKYDTKSYDAWLNHVYYKGTVFAESNMGTAESVTSLTANQINDFKRAYFCPANAFVTVVGAYTDEGFAAAKRLLEQLPALGTPKKNKVNKPIHFADRNIHNRWSVFDTEETTSEICFCFDVTPDCDYEAARFLSCMLGSGYASLLNDRLSEQAALTDEIICDIYSAYGFHRINIRYPIENEDLKKSAVILAQTLNMLKLRIETEWYEQNIVFYTDNFLKDYDDTQFLSDDYIFSDFSLDGAVVSEPKRCMDKYKRITLHQLSETARKIFTAENTSVIIETSLDEREVIERIEPAITLLNETLDPKDKCCYQR